MTEKSIEAILKEARQARGIRIESAHEATKIPLDVLKAIEEGYTVRALASPFYRKQFLKMYAGFLGVEVNDSMLVDPPKEEKAAPIFKKITPRPEIEAKPAGFALSKEQKQQIVLAIVGLFILFFVGKAVGFVVNKITHRKTAPKIVKVKEQKAVKVKSKPAVPEKPLVKKPEVKKEEIKKEEVKKWPVLAPELPIAVQARPAVKEVKPVEQESRIATPVVVSPQNGKMVNITVRAKKKSWLQVKVDGNTVFQSSLQKGAVENWQADEKIELTGNNILFLEFEVNGKMIGTLARTDGRVRKLIVTKNGLSVRK